MPDNDAMNDIVAIIFGAWYLCDPIFGLWDRNKQLALHDRIAKTRVVMKE